MILSQILMVISLVVLTYMVWMTMSSSDNSSSNGPNPTTRPSENFEAPPPKANPPNMNVFLDRIKNKLKLESVAGTENFGNALPVNEVSGLPAAPYPVPNPGSGDVSDVIINYSNVPSNVGATTIKKISEIKGMSDTDLMPSNYRKPEMFQNDGGNVFNNPPYQSNDNVKGVVDLSNSEINAAAFVQPTLPAGTSVQTEDVNDVYKVEGTDFLSAPLADRFYYTNSIANVNRNASHDFRGDIPTPYNDKLTPFYQSAIYGEPMTINRLSDCTK